MQNNVLSVWTDERVAELKKLWGDGFSCSQIAAELGCGITRNAVIGKAHRLGLSQRQHANGYLRFIDPIPPGTPRKSIMRSRERKPRLEVMNPNAKPPMIFAESNITGTPIKKRGRTFIDREMTKNELRAMLSRAVMNTAAMEVAE